MSWLKTFAEAAAQTDKFVDSEHHTTLLAAGLLGEAGSIATELKKQHREREAYPAQGRRIVEEVGDFLWYFVRLVETLDTSLLPELARSVSDEAGECPQSLQLTLELGAVVGDALTVVRKTHPSTSNRAGELRSSLLRIWSILHLLSRQLEIPLSVAAKENVKKIQSRWPVRRVYSGFFDERFPEEERLPRQLEVEFRHLKRGTETVVILLCNGVNLGDRLTDNIQDPDGYRFHDIFHLAHAVHLGWSPVVRALLRCKRKSDRNIDENEDGARAIILEEAVSAIVFNRAKELKFFEGLDHIDYDLLKTVSGLVHGYEVSTIPLWQWEVAILDGYSIFRRLCRNQGGRVVVDLAKRNLVYVAPPQPARVILQAH